MQNEKKWNGIMCRMQRAEGMGVGGWVLLILKWEFEIWNRLYLLFSDISGQIIWNIIGNENLFTLNFSISPPPPPDADFFPYLY